MPCAWYFCKCSKVPSLVLKLFINNKRTGAPADSRSDKTCRTIRSRKFVPSRTSSKLFGPCNPMLVPRPPLSLITTACANNSASAAASPIASKDFTPLAGSMPDSSIIPVSFASKAL